VSPRPILMRKISFEPGATYFKPAGVPLRSLEEVSVSFEEIESLRLTQLKGLSQSDSAEKMNISQPTFNRVFNSAVKKVSDALVNGKAIKIEGGNYEKKK